MIQITLSINNLVNKTIVIGAYAVTARYSEGSVNPKVRYSEGLLFRRSVIPKVR